MCYLTRFHACSYRTHTAEKQNEMYDNKTVTKGEGNTKENRGT